MLLLLWCRTLTTLCRRYVNNVSETHMFNFSSLFLPECTQEQVG